MTLKEALEAVVNESKQNAAITYAKAALDLGGSKNACLVEVDGVPGLFIQHEKTGQMMIGKELKVQLLYVSCNLNYWRGERAKEVKAVLKAALKSIK